MLFIESMARNSGKMKNLTRATTYNNNLVLSIKLFVQTAQIKKKFKNLISISITVVFQDYKNPGYQKKRFIGFGPCHYLSGEAPSKSKKKWEFLGPWKSKTPKFSKSFWIFNKAKFEDSKYFLDFQVSKAQNIPIRKFQSFKNDTEFLNLRTLKTKILALEP